MSWHRTGLVSVVYGTLEPRCPALAPNAAISSSIQWRGLNGSRKPYTAATQTYSRRAGTIVVAPVRPRERCPRALLRQRSGQVDLNEAVHRKLLHGGVGRRPGSTAVITACSHDVTVNGDLSVVGDTVLRELLDG